MTLLTVIFYPSQLNDDNLTELQLIGMARGVASGMAYLSAMNFIHRVMKIFCSKYLVYLILLTQCAQFSCAIHLLLVALVGGSVKQYI